jgi:hypothetical protein
MSDNKHDPEQSAPENWLQLLNDHCDIDLAFDGLKGWNHFHTDTNRGRLRSLQLRPAEAWEFFQRAEERADEFAYSSHNLLRRFCIKFYRFENALIQESAPEAGDRELTKSCLREVLRDESSDAAMAHHLRLYCKGMHLLHDEKYAEAKRVLLRLLDESRPFPADTRTVFHLATAVACRGMGEEEEAGQQLEYACLSIPALDSKFNMGMYAGIVGALFRIWDREPDAVEWDEFMAHLKFPPKTALLFRERARRIVDRTAVLKRVFLF